MKVYEKQPWTTDERKVLSDYYYIIPLEELMLILPKRTTRAIRSQVNYLKKKGYRFKYADKS